MNDQEREAHRKLSELHAEAAETGRPLEWTDETLSDPMVSYLSTIINEAKRLRVQPPAPLDLSWLEGLRPYVPDWVNWITVDSSHGVCCYGRKPSWNHNSKRWDWRQGRMAIMSDVKHAIPQHLIDRASEAIVKI